MYNNRIIPCLLRHNKGFVKTKKFCNPKYLGDPFNIVRLFNEKEVDELIILDIDKTVNQLEPDFDFIDQIASECFMPLCYGGGINNIQQIKKVFSLGVEKVALSSAVVNSPKLLSQASKIFGKQSIIVVMDIKKNIWGKYNIFTHNGKMKAKYDLTQFVKQVENYGAGEIIINSIDNDGIMMGYDIQLLQHISSLVSIPVVALGGAKNVKDMKQTIKRTNISAAAAGSTFVFSGPHNAVLINYPKLSDS